MLCVCGVMAVGAEAVFFVVLCVSGDDSVRNFFDMLDFRFVDVWWCSVGGI